MVAPCVCACELRVIKILIVCFLILQLIPALVVIEVQPERGGRKLVSLLITIAIIMYTVCCLRPWALMAFNYTVQYITCKTPPPPHSYRCQLCRSTGRVTRATQDSCSETRSGWRWFCWCGTGQWPPTRVNTTHNTDSTITSRTELNNNYYWSAYNYAWFDFCELKMLQNSY